MKVCKEYIHRFIKVFSNECIKTVFEKLGFSEKMDILVNVLIPWNLVRKYFPIMVQKNDFFFVEGINSFNPLDERIMYNFL